MSAKSTSIVISGKRGIIRFDRQHQAVSRHQIFQGAIYTLAAFAAFHLVIQVGYAYVVRDWTQASLVQLLRLELLWPGLDSGYPELLISLVVILIVWVCFSWMQVWNISLHRK